MEPRIQYAKTADGVNIACYAIGQGRPLVVVGATAGHLELEWKLGREMWEAIAQRWMLVRYDRRGYGLSDRDVKDFSIAALVRDFEAVADRLELKTFRLVAFGWDAPVAIAYAAAHPERLSHLVIWHGYARGADWWSGQSEALLALAQRDWKAGTDAWTLARLGWSEFGQTSAELWRQAVTPEAYVASLQYVREWDVTHLLPSVPMPTLVMQRREDQFPNIEVATRLAADIPNARLVLLEGSGPMGLDGAAIAQEFLTSDEPLAVPTPARRRLRQADRELAPVTILFTDVEGSTDLTQRFGDAKSRELLREHERIVRAALQASEGSEVKTMGDGFMLSFPSATRALECAVAIQQALATSDVRVRIGLNAGEPIAEDDDLFGTAVIVAARIASQAQGGEILASDVVRQLVAGKGFLFNDHGDHALKGFEEPVRVYEVSWRN